MTHGTSLGTVPSDCSPTEPVWGMESCHPSLASGCYTLTMPCRWAGSSQSQSHTAIQGLGLACRNKLCYSGWEGTEPSSGCRVLSEQVLMDLHHRTDSIILVQSWPSPSELLRQTLIHSRPASVRRVAILGKAMGTAEIAAVGAIGIIAVKGAWGRRDLKGTSSHIMASVNLTLGKESNRDSEFHRGQQGCGHTTQLHQGTGSAELPTRAPGVNGS